MHISPGVVTGTKLVLGYVTGGTSLVLGLKMAYDTARTDGGTKAVLLRSIFTTALVFCFFQLLPHYRVGVSEVHFIFGALLYLVFGAGPAAIGLALGLLLQGVLFVPADLPQYFLNVTTLIVPLWLVSLVAKRIVARHTPYVDLKYWQALVLSLVYQGGVIVIVALWATYGQGADSGNLAAIGKFGLNYLIVVVVEPLLTLAVLALARKLDRHARSPIFYNRLHHPVN